MCRMNLGDYLLTRLKEVGIDHMIGVPGDFNLAFLEQVVAFYGMEWVGATNELNAAYAADGYARLRGASALLVTYGVGDLSALNGIAGAYAEHVPMIVISGVPPLRAIRNRELVHHTAGTGAYEDVMSCMAQFTAAQARITPANAAVEIDRLVCTAMREKRPVYLQLPSDICWLEIEAPLTPLTSWSYSGDAKRNEMVVDLIAERIQNAQRPALLIDADTHRFKLGQLISELGEHAGVPFATMASGRSIFNEQHPLYRGIYGGQASASETRETVEGSDCLVAIGVRFFDATTGYFSQKIPTHCTVLIDAYSVTIDGVVYEGVSAAEILKSLKEKLPARSVEAALPRVSEHVEASDWPKNEPLTHARLWPRMEKFLREGDLLFAENGTPLSGLSGVRLPAHTSFVSQNCWGSIGYTLPAILGAMLAKDANRHILFIGDGSLQMTVQELSTMLRLGLKPLIFVINNRGYTIERVILGPHAAYNDVQNWDYAGLPGMFADGRPMRGLRAQSEAELEAILATLEMPSELTLIELALDPLDAPLGLQRMGPMVAEYDYGDTGPQAEVNKGLSFAK